MEYNKPRYNPKIHHRRSIRLKGYDYSQAGLYFITICCQDRICRFGEIIVGAYDMATTRDCPYNGRPDNSDNDCVDVNIENTTTMILNDAGKMVDDEWLALVDRFPNIALHEYIVMPNHFHCILEIVSNGENVATYDRATTRVRPYDHAIDDGRTDNDVPMKNKTIGDMMDAFKSITTVKYIRGVRANPCGCPAGIKCICGGWKPFDGKLWQRDYFEHIIRDEESYLRISEYIKNNPAKWENDKFYTP